MFTMSLVYNAVIQTLSEIFAGNDGKNTSLTWCGVPTT